MELKDIIKYSNEIKDNMDIYYLAFMLLLASNRQKYSKVPELCLVLDENNLNKFLDVFGGETLHIPTKEEFSSFLKAVLVYYYIQSGKSKKEAYKLAEAQNDANIYSYVKMIEENISYINLLHLQND